MVNFYEVEAKSMEELDNVLGVITTENLNVSVMHSSFIKDCPSTSDQPYSEEAFDDDEFLKLLQPSPQPDDSFNGDDFNDNRFNQDFDEITGIQRNGALIDRIGNSAIYGGGSEDNEVQSPEIDSNAIYGGGVEDNQVPSYGSCAAICSECVLL